MSTAKGFDSRKQAERYVELRPTEYPKGAAIVQNDAGRWVVTANGAPAANDSVKPATEGAAAIDAIDVQRAAAKATAEKVKHTIRLEKIRGDLLTAVLAPPEYLWAPRIPKDGVTLLVGEDGLGKSWLALMISLHTAAGRPLFDIPLPCGRAIYIHAEDRRPMIERRVQTILRSWKDPKAAALALENFSHYDTLADQMLLLDCSTREVKFTPWVFALRDQLGKAQLVTLDPAARLHNGPENDNGLVTQLISAGETIALGTHGAVMMPHHPNKQGTRDHVTDGTDVRGGGGFRAGARSQLRLIAANKQDIPGASNVTAEDLEQQNILILSQPKLNDGKKAPKIYIRRLDDGVMTPFNIQRGDPLHGLVEWFKSENKGKAFTPTRARDNRKLWGSIGEPAAEQFLVKQIADGALIESGKVNGHPAYVPSTVTLERFADPFERNSSYLEI